MIIHMKKLRSFVFLFCFIVQGIFLFGEETVIVSWNICHPGENRDTFMNTAGWLAEEYDVDILAVQEINVNNKGFLAALEKILEKNTGEDWASLSTAVHEKIKNQTVGDQFYNCFRNDQNNAFLYRTGKFDAVNKYKAYSFDNFAGCRYKVDKNNMLVALFKSRESKEDLTLVNVHLPYNNKENRLRDMYTAARLFHNIPDSKYKIIMGDFNYRADELKKGFPYVAVREATTVNTKGQYANSYDHFAYNKKVADRLTEKPRAIRIADAEYRKLVSDHVPIILKIRISE